MINGKDVDLRQTILKKAAELIIMGHQPVSEIFNMSLTRLEWLYQEMVEIFEKMYTQR